MENRAFLQRILFFFVITASVYPLGVPSALASICHITPVYQGPQQAVIDFAFSSEPTETSLIATLPGGGEVTVAGPATSGGSRYHHTNLTYGSIVYRLSDGTVCDGSPVTVGNFALGKPIYGESINGIVMDAADVTLDDTTRDFSLSDATVHGSLHLFNSSAANKFSVSNSVVLGLVELQGGPTRGAFELTGNTIRQGLFLPFRGNYTIANNILLDPVQIGSYDINDWGGDGPDPVITGNSFVGKRAISSYSYWWTNPVHHKVPLGCNYFGHTQGYTPAWDNNPISLEPPFLHYKGAYVDEHVAQVSCLEAGGAYPGSRIFPKIWAVQWIVGQNALNHELPGYGDKDDILMDRNTLLSVDIRSTTELLQGARFYVEFNGQVIDSEPALVRRAPDTHLRSAGFQNTVNFILPPVALGDEAYNLNFVVYADVSQVSGDLGKQTGPLWLTGGSIRFNPPPKRKFTVSVSPVHVYGGCSGKGSTADILANMKDYLGAMFPVRQKDISVTMGIPYSFFCGPLSMVSTTAFWTALSAEAGIAAGIGGSTGQYDRIVMAVPRAASGLSIEGANSMVASRVLLVREDKPLALVHEMGHSLGLGDQYSSTAHGVPLTGMTAFDPDAVGVNGIRPGQHFPLYETSPSPMYDIMADNDFIWSWVKGSYLSFKNYFSSLATPAPLPRAETRSSGPLAGPGERQILISAVMWPSNQYANFFPMMQFDTLKITDITGSGLNPGSSPEHTWDDRFYSYSVYGLDAGGQTVFWDRMIPHSAYPYFYKTFTIPAAVTRLEINGGHPDHVGFFSKSSSFSATLISPSQNALLGENLSLQWLQSHPDLVHIVLFSSDGGATWKPMGAPFKAANRVFSTEFLPSGTPLSIKTITSDGFQNVVNRVDGLTVTNRAPRVRIVFPPEGAKAPPDYVWNLSASAADIEDTGFLDQPLSATWTSSRDGVLGQGKALPGVVLTAGTHVLTFQAVDHEGVAGQAQVTVQVGPCDAVDLTFRPQDLTVYPPNVDPWLGGGSPVLTTGGEHRLRLQLQGTGAPLVVTLAVYATPPGGAESLLTRQTVNVGVFETVSIWVPYTPTVEGDYSFRAAIEGSNLSDPDSTNNNMTWFLSTNLPLPDKWSVFLPLVLR